MIIVPDNYKLIVKVYQFTLIPLTFNRVPSNKRLSQITEFLKQDIENFSTNNQFTTINIDDELHLLRLLRHVRETVENIKLNPNNLEIWFDNPDDANMIVIDADDDGDLTHHVPGGFFTQRFTELF